jgi:hypothetical protein
LGLDLALGGSGLQALLGPSERPLQEFLPERKERRCGMHLVTRIAAAISSLVALVLAGGAAWKA